MTLIKKSVPTLVVAAAALTIGAGGAAVAVADPDGKPGSTPFMSSPETIAHEIAVTTDGQHSATAECPDGKVAIGGGAETLPQGSWTAHPVHNGPTGLTQADDGTWSGSEWTVTVDAERTAGGGNATLKAYVICAAG